MEFEEFPPAPESAPESFDAIELSITKLLGESQFGLSIAQEKSAQTPSLDNAITQKVKKFEAMRSLKRLLPYIVMLADITFDLHDIIQLLEYWFKPRYDAAVEAHGDDKRVVHMLVSKSLEPLDLATKIDRRRSINFNFNYSWCNYFVTEIMHDSDGLDCSMVPMEDLPHLLKRQREHEEEIDRYVQIMMKVQPDPLEFFRFITNFVSNGVDSDGLVKRGDWTDPSDPSD